jgi:hypothetical protein
LKKESIVVFFLEEGINRWCFIEEGINSFFP